MAAKRAKKASKKDGKKKTKAPHEEILESASKIWLAGLGAMAMAEDEGTKFFRRLVERGEEFQDKGRERIEEVKEQAEKRWDELGDAFDKRIADALDRLGVPTREEVKELNQRLEKVNSRLEEMKKS